jgi:hypothetical protein
MLAAEGGAPGKVYVLEKDLPAVEAGRRDPEPLVLHVSVGDCLVVKLRNATRAGPVSYTCDLLASDPSANGGPGAGREPDQSVPPGGTRTYRFYASPEVGETVAVSRDWGDPLTNTALGLYGAVVVGPEGARYRHPTTGADLAGEASWQVDVVPATGSAWRDFTLVFQDGDDSIGTHRMPYTNHVRGVTGVNYRVAPDVPALEANAGDDVRIHLVAPSSEQAQVFSLEGHRWPAEPGLAGTPLRSSQAFAGAEAMTLRLDGGAGGPEGLAGTYRWEDHRLPYAEAGLWGELHVRPPGGRSIEPALLPLAESRSQASTGAALFGVGAAGAVAALALFTRRRHARKAPRRRARPQAT